MKRSYRVERRASCARRRILKFFADGRSSTTVTTRQQRWLFE